MRKKASRIFGLLILFLGGLCFNFVKAQEYKDVAWSDPRPQDSSYYGFREKNSISPFNRKKVQNLIDKRFSTLPDEALTDYDGGISIVILIP